MPNSLRKLLFYSLSSVLFLIVGGNALGAGETVAQNLDTPWEIAFLPEGEIILTERPGNLVFIRGAEKQSIPVPGVAEIGEGGLLGLALHPDFNRNDFLYLYQTYREEGSLFNRVDRYKLDLKTKNLRERKEILSRIPASENHNGGRIAFGPDQTLYIGTGDAQSPKSAQDKNSLAGKILRINEDGSVPTDNPFGNAVYSLGHRNVQGLAWDESGRLWSSEHGPSGTQSGFDEINLIQKGANYGWPEIRGNQSMDGMISPVIESGQKETWAPGAVEIIGQKLFFAGLRGQTLYSADIANSSLLNLKRSFQGEWGRLRVLKEGPLGSLYLGNSNRDGRGNPGSADDRIFKLVNP